MKIKLNYNVLIEIRKKNKNKIRKIETILLIFFSLMQNQIQS